MPLVVLLAGGYGTAAWRYSARFFGWLATGRVVEPPDDAELILERFRMLTARWDGEIRGAESGWGLTAEDLIGVTPRADTRFLGRFGLHDVEVQLERLGLMDHLRARGFRHPVPALDVAPDGLPLVRVWADADRSVCLMELKARRSRSVLPGMELIHVEWLKLQNPQARFTQRRPQLPDQEHPGLGMLREVAAWLVVLCEQLSLDGVAFVPSQYYMAAVGHRQLKFVDPRMQARYEAMRDALGELPLGEANRAVNAGELKDTATGEAVTWKPELMVLPVSDRLRRYVTGAQYRKGVEDELSRLSFRRSSARDG